MLLNKSKIYAIVFVVIINCLIFLIFKSINGVDYTKVIVHINYEEKTTYQSFFGDITFKRSNIREDFLDTRFLYFLNKTNIHTFELNPPYKNTYILVKDFDAYLIFNDIDKKQSNILVDYLYKNLDIFIDLNNFKRINFQKYFEQKAHVLLPQNKSTSFYNQYTNFLNLENIINNTKNSAVTKDQIFDAFNICDKENSKIDKYICSISNLPYKVNISIKNDSTFNDFNKVIFFIIFNIPLISLIYLVNTKKIN